MFVLVCLAQAGDGLPCVCLRLGQAHSVTIPMRSLLHNQRNLSEFQSRQYDVHRLDHGVPHSWSGGYYAICPVADKLGRELWMCDARMVMNGDDDVVFYGDDDDGGGDADFDIRFIIIRSLCLQLWTDFADVEGRVLCTT